MQKLFGHSSQENEGEWISVSDLMAGLMVIFLFIAIVYIRPLIEQKEQALREKEELATSRQTIKQIAVAWKESEINIYKALEREFRKDLRSWNAEIEPDSLVIRFRAPDVLFDQNSALLKERFKNILADFFPRYLEVLRSFISSIEEVRIEGHTSSIWNAWTPLRQAYFNNMKLSQERTRAVLEFVLTLPNVDHQLEWARAHVTANGLSSSRPIRDASGKENREASRRVEFRVRTRTHSEIVRILEEVQ